MDGYADIARLLVTPPGLGRGFTQLRKLASPSAGANFTYAISNDAWERIRAVTFQLATSSAAANRQVLLNYQDGDNFTFDQVQASVVIPASVTATSFLSARSPSTGTDANSVAATNSVTSPTLGQVICSASVPGGDYVINWQVGLGGTTSATDANNFALQVGGVTVATSINGNTSGTLAPQDAVTVEIPAGGATVQIIAIAAGTASSVYRATFTAIENGTLTYYANIPDYIMKSGHQLQIQVVSIQAADQLSNIGILTERFPSNYAQGDIEGEHRHAVERLLQAVAGGK